MRFGGRASMVACAAGLCLGAVVLAADAVQADSSAQLPISSFHQMAVDAAHGQIFISSPAQDEILVTNLSGQEITTIAGQTGVTGIALSSDGSTLYAALSAGDAVTAISTTTLQQVASYPLAAGDSPQDVAVQSGEVWVSYNSGPGSAAIGEIDPTNSSFQTPSAMAIWDSAPALAADPSNSGILVAVETGSTSSTNTSALVSYNTANQVGLIDQSSLPSGCENVQDVAVLPGGSYFVLACASLQADGLYSTVNMNQQASYASSSNPTAVAIDSGGDVAVGGDAANNGLAPAPDVNVFQHGGSAPVNELAVNIPASAALAPRGLAWSPDGSQLFAVVKTTSPTTYAMEIVDQPVVTRSTLTLTGPSSARVTHAISLTGNLGLSTGSPPAGTAIKVTRTQAGSTATATFTASTATGGGYQLTDTPPAAGTYTYSAVYAGSTSIAPAQASQVVTVSKLPVALSLSSTPRHVTYNSTVHLTVHLGPTFTSRTVRIYVHDLSKKSTTLLRTATIGSSGALTINYKAPHTAIFTAKFAGDAHYAAKTVTHTVSVPARVSERLTGYFRKSGKYFLFHVSRFLFDHTTVSPNKRGQCVKFQSQEHIGGAWRRAGTTHCFRLSSASAFVQKFGLTLADQNIPYRIRVDFIHKSSDPSNANSQSPWLYFKVEP